MMKVIICDTIKWVDSYEEEIYMENINGIMDDIYLYHVIDE